MASISLILYLDLLSRAWKSSRRHLFSYQIIIYPSVALAALFFFAHFRHLPIFHRHYLISRIRVVFVFHSQTRLFIFAVFRIIGRIFNTYVFHYHACHNAILFSVHKTAYGCIALCTSLTFSSHAFCLLPVAESQWGQVRRGVTWRRLLSASFHFCRLLSATLEFCRFLSDLVGISPLLSAFVGNSTFVVFFRFLSVAVGISRLVSAVVGYCRLLSVSAGFCRFLPVTLSTFVGNSRQLSATLRSFRLPTLIAEGQRSNWSRRRSAESNRAEKRVYGATTATWGDATGVATGT